MPDFAIVRNVFMKFKGTIEYRQIVSNLLIHTNLEAPGYCLPALTANAPDTFPHPTPEHQYHFLFWTLDGRPNLADPDASEVDIPPQGSDCVHTAVAWYYAAGGPVVPNSRFWVWAFDMETGSFSGESPIAAPADAVGQNPVSTEDQGWTLVAKDSIGSGSLTRPFHHWWTTNAASNQSQNDKNLVIGQGVGGSAIAFYGADPIDGPPPGDPGQFEVKPVKDAIAEVKRGANDVDFPFDFSIYFRRLSARLDRLEQQVSRGRSFISRGERPKVLGTNPGTKPGRG